MSKRKQEIIEQIKQEILNLELKPGDMISEALLTQRFGLSRTPIRDILKHLSSEDYIHIYPQKGSVISYIDLDSVEQIIYMRNALEKEIFQDLKRTMTVSAMHQLTSILHQQQSCIQDSINFSKFIKYDDLFHQTCFDLAGRSFLWNIIQRFNVHYLRYRKLHMLDIKKLERLIKEHLSILNYLQGNEDIDISQLIHKHIRADVNSTKFMEDYKNYIKTYGDTTS